MSKITKAIVWSNVGCSYCEQAKNLLKSKNIDKILSSIEVGEVWGVGRQLSKKLNIDLNLFLYYKYHS